MALTHTPQAEIGKSCPDFELNSVDGKSYSLNDFSKYKALLVMFICNHCPYVKAVEDRILDLARDLLPKGAGFVAICSNESINYPEDAPNKLFERWKEKKYPFPYLHDETQKAAKDFQAVCTPDFFLYDKNRKLTYRGRLDDSWKDPDKVTKQDLREAIICILNDKAIPQDQKPSMGCSIKGTRYLF